MITIKEIAEQAGVSIGTVDRVIHDRGRVSQKTREKILSIMENEGYRRNIVASQLSKPRQTVLAVIMPHPWQNDKFWQMLEEGIRKAWEKISYFKVDLRFFFYDRYSSESFSRQFNEAISCKPEGFLIAPILAEDMMKFRYSLPEKSKVVFFNSDLPDFPRLSCIGQDSYESGRTAGFLMHMITKGKGAVSVIELHSEDFHINTRAQGFRDYMKEQGRGELGTYPLPPEDRKDLFELTVRTIMEEHSDLAGLFVPNSSVHFFAERLPLSVRIIGYDLIEANSNMLREGKIDFLISQQPRKQGEMALEYLIRCTVFQEEIPSEHRLPIEIVCRENLDSYLK